MNDFTTAADEHINDLIEALCDEAKRDAFADRDADVQRCVDQIAQLRASQNPVIKNVFRKA